MNSIFFSPVEVGSLYSKAKTPGRVLRTSRMRLSHFLCTGSFRLYLGCGMSCDIVNFVHAVKNYTSR